jgi:hypothetical protein
VEFIRQWKVGNQTFDNKADALKAEARAVLDTYGTVDQLIADADAVIAALRPFATPKRRKSANGQTNVPSGTRASARKGASAEASAG